MDTSDMDQAIVNLYKEWDWSLIPAHMWQPVKNYIEFGIQPGGFLSSVLEHDFYDAIFRADFANKASITGWAEFLAWYVPASCHGCRENVSEWCRIGGWRGLMKQNKNLLKQNAE